MKSILSLMFGTKMPLSLLPEQKKSVTRSLQISLNNSIN